ncbi:MAG: hypothetical protein KME30_28990 [Iphinoe sp. HA4291-MV1]|jgi:threonyl-tRNA synthetase|nr:hypothetical protein [Iphinoe sp. HA4291-MV1]
MYDHRELAKAMDLFHFEEHSPGMVFWHPMCSELQTSSDKTANKAILKPHSLQIKGVSKPQ